MDSATPSPVSPSREEIAISEGTPVFLNIRTMLSFVAAIVVIVLGGAGGYYALASTDKDHESKIQQLEKKSDEFATKSDLKALRMQVRMDLLSSVWSCSPVQGGGMQCHPRIPHNFDEAAGQ